MNHQTLAVKQCPNPACKTRDHSATSTFCRGCGARLISNKAEAVPRTTHSPLDSSAANKDLAATSICVDQPAKPAIITESSIHISRCSEGRVLTIADITASGDAMVVMGKDQQAIRFNLSNAQNVQLSIGNQASSKPDQPTTDGEKRTT